MSNFDDVNDKELVKRLDLLITKYEKIAPLLVEQLKQWSRARREIEAINLEIEKRGIKEKEYEQWQ